ncbi:hypothetical protein D9757_013319 [Collybiopsis confluens]|uniref:Nephrocystin 3-like N-terminal domain-containing protein n=1 Tax=Collybiopsis confluens TaxID=2823264 RepID=A0A8H5LMG0_9AGAR|nr:hypothetical protein D9757_013319 [Collybiopsis confluens]
MPNFRDPVEDSVQERKKDKSCQTTPTSSGQIGLSAPADDSPLHDYAVGTIDAAQRLPMVGSSNFSAMPLNQVNPTVNQNSIVQNVLAAGTKIPPGSFQYASNFIMNSPIFHLQSESSGFSELLKELAKELPYSKEAFFDTDMGVQNGRRLCTPGTRTQILANIEAWAATLNPYSPSGYWISGMAGTGKSTIAMQLSECNNYQRIIPTLAYQMAKFSSLFASALREALVADLDLCLKRPTVQVEYLLIRPWEKVAGKLGCIPIVVIDALDECVDVFHLLEPLISGIQSQRLKALKFLFTSRPEQKIAATIYKSALALNLGPVVKEFILHQIEEVLVKEDIMSYLREELQDISSSEGDINSLADLSGRLFIYAATVVKLIQRGNAAPSRKQERLKNIVKLGQNPENLQSLYATIMVNAIDNNGVTPKEIADDWKIVYIYRKVNVQQIGRTLYGQAMTIIEAHASVRNVAFSADGTKIVSGSVDRTVRIWDAMTGAPLGQSLQGHGHWVQSVAFSPDGTRIVSGSVDKTLRIWDATTVVQLGQTIKGHDHSVESVGFSPDGTKIVSGSRDRTVRIWDAMTGAQLGQSLEGHKNCVQSVAFSPDGTKIVSGSWDKTVRIWNPTTGAQLGKSLHGHQDWVQSVAFSPDGTRIVSGSWDKTVRIWDLATGAQLDGTKIVSGSVDKTVRIWDATTGTQLGQFLEGHNHSVETVAFSPDGTRIVSGSRDETIRMWDVMAGTPWQPKAQPLSEGHKSWVQSVSFSPDGTKIVSGSWDKTVKIWNAVTGAPLGQSLEAHDDWVQSVAFSPDGTKIVSGSFDQKIRIWNARTGAQLGRSLEGHNHFVQSVAFSSDGSKIVSGSVDTTVRVWDVMTGTQLGDSLQGHDNSVESVSFSPDGTKIVSGSWDKTVRIWDATTGAQLGQSLPSHDLCVASVAFSPDGTRIVSGSWDKTVRIWDSTTGKQLGQAANLFRVMRNGSNLFPFHQMELELYQGLGIKQLESGMPQPGHNSDLCRVMTIGFTQLHFHQMGPELHQVLVTKQ